MALSAAEGALTGLAIGKGFKIAALAQSAGLGIEAGTVAMGAAAYAGHGQRMGRAKAIAKQEAVNQAIGWGTYGASILGRQAGRKAAIEMTVKAAGYASKILSFSRKALRMA